MATPPIAEVTAQVQASESDYPRLARSPGTQIDRKVTSTFLRAQEVQQVYQPHLGGSVGPASLRLGHPDE